MTLFEEVFAEYEAETLARQPVFGTEEWYRSGRVSKAWPEKENKEWWLENGPRFVELWTLWRDQSGLTISEFVDTETGLMIPGIELDTWAERPEQGLYLKSCIDRVMEDEHGQLYIVDLKTGSSTDPWPLQMALNNLGLIEQYGVRAKYAGFWHARKGGVENWFDLDEYPDEYLWGIVEKAKKMRDQELFIAAPHSNLCKSACGVAQFCTAMGGRRNLDAFLSTMQQ